MKRLLAMMLALTMLLTMTPFAVSEETDGATAPVQETQTEPTGGEEPAPMNEGGEEPAPSDEGGEEPAPTEEGGEEPAPTDEGGEEPASSEEGGEEPASSDEGGEEPTPTDEGGEEPAPSDEGGEEPAPSEEGGEDPAPSDEGGEDQQDPSPSDDETVGAREENAVNVNQEAGQSAADEAVGFAVTKSARASYIYNLVLYQNNPTYNGQPKKFFSSYGATVADANGNNLTGTDEGISALEGATLTFKLDGVDTEASALQAVDAGMYTIDAYLWVGGQVVDSESLEIRIKPKDVSVSFTAKSIPYDGNVRTDYSEFIAGYTINGAVEGDDVSAVHVWNGAQPFSARNAGEYPVSLSVSLTGEDAANYNLTSSSAEFLCSITSVEPEMKTTANVVYYSGSGISAETAKSAISVTVGGSVLDADLYTVSLPETISRVGKYPYTVTLKQDYTPDANNYTALPAGTTVSGTLIVWTTEIPDLTIYTKAPIEYDGEGVRASEFVDSVSIEGYGTVDPGMYTIGFEYTTESAVRSVGRHQLKVTLNESVRLLFRSGINYLEAYGEIVAGTPKLEVVLKDGPFVYDGASYKDRVVQAVKVRPGTDMALSLNESYYDLSFSADPVSAGEYTVTVTTKKVWESGEDPAIYRLPAGASVTADFTIVVPEKPQYEITVTPRTGLVYNGQRQQLVTAELTDRGNAVSGVTYSYTAEKGSLYYASNSVTAAGTYKVTVTATVNGEKIESDPVEVTIAPKPVWLILGQMTPLVYDSRNHTVREFYSPTFEGVCGTDAVKLTGGDSASNAGDHVLGNFGLDNANYTLSDDSPKTAPVTIQRVVMSADQMRTELGLIKDQASFLYDGVSRDGEAVAKRLEANDLAVSVTYSLASKDGAPIDSAVDAGKYQLIVNVRLPESMQGNICFGTDEAGNPLSEFSFTVSFEITPSRAKLYADVTAPDFRKGVRPAASELTVSNVYLKAIDPTNPVPTILEPGDYTVEWADDVPTGENFKAKTKYTVNFTFTESGLAKVLNNYGTIGGQADVVSGRYIAQLDVSGQALNSSYSGTPLNADPYIYSIRLDFGENVSPRYSENYDVNYYDAAFTETALNAGNYVIRVSPKQALNDLYPDYVILPDEVNFWLYSASVTVIPAATKVYGQQDPVEYTLDTSDDLEAEAYAAIKDLEVSFTRESGENVDEYAYTGMTIGGKSGFWEETNRWQGDIGFGNFNYLLAPEATLSIEKAQATVQVNVDHNVYTGEAFAADAFGNSVTVNGFELDDKNYTVGYDRWQDSFDTFKGEAPVNVGQYGVKYTITNAEINRNFYLYETSKDAAEIVFYGDVVIDELEGSLRVTPQSLVYDGIGHEAGEFIATAEIVDGQGSTLMVLDEDQYSAAFDNQTYKYNVSDTAPVTVTVTDSNIIADAVEGVEATITHMPVTLSPETGRGKIYGQAEPAASWTFEPAENDEFASLLSGAELNREQNDVVGEWAYLSAVLYDGETPVTIAADKAANIGNFSVTFSPMDKFAITPLSITVNGTAGAVKNYSEEDSELFCELVWDNTDSVLTDAAIRDILGVELRRENSESEGVGKYDILLHTANGDTLRSGETKICGNFEVTYENEFEYEILGVVPGMEISVDPVTDADSAIRVNVSGTPDAPVTIVVEIDGMIAAYEEVAEDGVIDIAIPGATHLLPDGTEFEAGLPEGAEIEVRAMLPLSNPGYVTAVNENGEQVAEEETVTGALSVFIDAKEIKYDLGEGTAIVKPGSEIAVSTNSDWTEWVYLTIGDAEPVLVQIESGKEFIIVADKSFVHAAQFGKGDSLTGVLAETARGDAFASLMVGVDTKDPVKDTDEPEKETEAPAKKTGNPLPALVVTPAAEGMNFLAGFAPAGSRVTVSVGDRHYTNESESFHGFTRMGEDEDSDEDDVLYFHVTLDEPLEKGDAVFVKWVDPDGAARRETLITEAFDEAASRSVWAEAFGESALGGWWNMEETKYTPEHYFVVKVNTDEITDFVEIPVYAYGGYEVGSMRIEKADGLLKTSYVIDEDRAEHSGEYRLMVFDEKPEADELHEAIRVGDNLRMGSEIRTADAEIWIYAAFEVKNLHAILQAEEEPFHVIGLPAEAETGE